MSDADFGAGAPRSPAEAPAGEPAPGSPAPGPAPTAGDGATSVPSEADAGAVSAESPAPSVEDLLVTLETVTAERDEYLDGMRRLQAEFENYRKAVAKRESDAVERANDKIIAEILPVLDACDGAVASGAENVAPLRTTILDNLVRLGLERMDPAGQPFNPEHHEAVMHEESSEVTVPTVAEVLRVGYGWNGRVIRPAMVKTVG